MKPRLVDNPPNPYLTQHAEWLGPPPEAKIEIYEETAGSVLSQNDSPDVPYNWSVNPYRGCQHACAYCYARTYHEYLGYGAGTDFDTKLVVKRNAAELLRKALSRKKWRREIVNFSGITDCYQPIEASYGITRACLDVCAELRNPVAITTKGFLVVRDRDVLADVNERASARVAISIPFADGDAVRSLEPMAPPPSRRFEAIRRLREAGLPVGVIVSPVIPGLSDVDIPKILEQAAEAGALWASYTALRLPGSVEQVFVNRLREVMPLRADRVLNRLRDIRGGKLSDTRFGKRMRGEGVYWDSVRSLFEVSRKRCGLAPGYGCDEDESMCPSPTLREYPKDGAPEAADDAGQLAFDFGK